MILSTCGARAVVVHTTNFLSRAAWARRTSHHDAVVARAVAVPACRKTSRRVSMVFLPSLVHPQALPPVRHRGGLRHQKRAHWRQGVTGHEQGISVTAPLGLLIPRIDLHHLLMCLFDCLLGLPTLAQHALDHVANRIGAEHLAYGGIHGTGRGELPSIL